ncbi:hypothetical protein EV356DRAFT_449576 [Viridothelium virens]|uniref:Calponin-homology (CH) domain-containing protein n=1 Tax=Viridothelium virens TaxID=1048519 RepID=A0A6A6H3Z4_VIRVR|nr:hypothetical protein EV356DRAFT_449576 [Viridothelium virens]
MASELPSPPSDRTPSPSPSISPSLALGAVPLLEPDRSVSGTSSVSSISTQSTNSRVSDGAIVGRRRRGFMRPQATVFADSARNRNSVMSLGSIAHVQHYFARTGLLDGKGAQLAKERKKRAAAEAGVSIRSASFASDTGSADFGFSDNGSLLTESLLDSPVDREEEIGSWEFTIPGMLPPTVSTYKEKPAYVPPPPDGVVLRRELREALEDARKVLKETDRDDGVDAELRNDTSSPPEPRTARPESQGFHEIEGLHVLDIITLAIRATKNYYTAHENPQWLCTIKSEKQIRAELYQILDVLKKMASRSFSGGMRQQERESISCWITDIDNLLNTEEEQERLETNKREQWTWREGNWTGREREREYLFIKSFDPRIDELPPWTDPADASSLPTPFLQTFQNGLRLIHLHNALVQKSQRHFGDIKNFHTDTNKPYRCAENLQYWIKAAQLRWEVRLDVNALTVVQGNGEETWNKFDVAILKWCKAVREEIISELDEQQVQAKPPALRIDVGDVAYEAN